LSAIQFDKCLNEIQVKIQYLLRVHVRHNPELVPTDETNSSTRRKVKTLWCCPGTTSCRTSLIT